MTEEIFGGTDRSTVLVGVAMIDAALEAALKVVLVKFETEQEMRDMFRSEVAPLADLAAKIKVAKAVGLFSADAARVLNIIRNIRNAFAHSYLPLKFEESPIAEECARLPELKVNIFTTEVDKYPMTPLRRRFVSTCAVISAQLEHFASTHGGEDVVIRIPNERLPTLPATP